jgi:hypothetical protein
MAPKNPTPAQIAALKKSKGVKPTAAFTKPGQKATGLAKSTVKDRFSSTAKTPVKNAGSGFAGSGSSLGSSLGVSKITKGSVANAALAATLLPGSGQVTRYVAGKAGGIVANAALKASTKGFGASGAGGKIKNVMTPMGPTIASTSIGSAGQQSARMNNLLTGKVKEATSAGLDVANKVVRGMGKAGNIVKAGSIAAVATPPIAKKISTPVKKAVLGKPPVKKK